MSCGGEATITARVSTQPTDSAVLFCSWFCPCVPPLLPPYEDSLQGTLTIAITSSGFVLVTAG